MSFGNVRFGMHIFWREYTDNKSIQGKIKDLNARLTFHSGSTPTNSKHTSLPLSLINLPSCEIHRVSLDPPPRAVQTNSAITRTQSIRDADVRQIYTLY